MVGKNPPSVSLNRVAKTGGEGGYGYLQYVDSAGQCRYLSKVQEVT